MSKGPRKSFEGTDGSGHGSLVRKILLISIRRDGWHSSMPIMPNLTIYRSVCFNITKAWWMTVQRALHKELVMWQPEQERRRGHSKACAAHRRHHQIQQVCPRTVTALRDTEDAGPAHGTFYCNHPIHKWMPFGHPKVNSWKINNLKH